MTHPPDTAAVPAEAQCFRLVRGLPCLGVLRVGDGRVRFEPVGALGKVLHGAPVDVPLVEIDAVDAGGVGRSLVVTAGGRTYSFGGAGARGLAEPLRAAVAAATRPAAPVIPLFGAPTTPVIRGEATFFVGRFLSVGGTAALSQSALSFVPRSRLESWMFGAGALELPLDELEGAALRGVRPVLVVRCRHRTWRFGGALAPALCGAIHILQGGPFRETLAPGDREVVVEAFPARLDGVPGSGTLVVGSHRLTFVPHGGAAAGALVEVPLPAVTRVAAVEGSTRALEIQQGPKRTVIHVAHAQERAREIGRLLLAVRTRDEPAVLRNGTIEPECFDALLAEWTRAGRLEPGSPTERTFVAGAVLQWPVPHAARRGWVGATSERAVFLPAGAPDGGEAPRVFSDVVAQPEDDDGERTIVLGGAPEDRLVPRGGRLLVDAFWGAWRQHHPVASTGSARVEQEVGPLLGTALFVEIVDGQEAVATLPYAEVTQEGPLLLLGYQGTPDRHLEEGRRITLHVGRVEGMFQVDAVVHHVQRSETGGIQIALEISSHVTHIERRGGFRVPSSDPVVLHVIEPRRGSWTVAATVDGCELDDLSIVGCGVWVPQELPQDARLRLTLPLLEGPLDVTATIARHERPRRLRAPWRYGLRFLRLPEVSRDRIHADLLARQRQEALRRAEDDAG